LGAINVLNSVRDAAIAGRSIRLFQASSSEMFGSSDLALNEFSAMKPHSPYAVSKYVIHSLANRYRENFELQIACGIMFNHESELRPEIFVTQKIIRNLVRLKRGEIDTFELGNIEISRDWGYAPEFVEAMYLITENGVSEDFVIGTGVPHTLREFIQAAIDVLGLACVTDDVIKINPSLYRQSDIAMTFADPRKIFDRFAWRAQLDLYGLVEKLCNYQLLL
jgi:GDPmannose 4,6-dehydratase